MIPKLANCLLQNVWVDGKELTSDMLSQAYRQGIFPMTGENGEVEWYWPRRRAIFPNCEMQVSKSLQKRMRQGGYTVTFDAAFEQVMRNCFRPEHNWLSEDFVRAYGDAHREGWGHSCEVWVENELVGGVYGLGIGGYFAAESMFHTKTDMSKIALFSLIQKCNKDGYVIFDAQILNSHLKSLGCVEVDASEFVLELEKAVKMPDQWLAD